MRLLPVLVFAIGLVSAQKTFENEALASIASDSEVNKLLDEYQNQVMPSSLGRSFAGGAGRLVQNMLDGRQLPPGIKLTDFITAQGTFDTMGFLIALKNALIQQATLAQSVAAQAAATTTTTAETTTTTTTTTKATTKAPRKIQPVVKRPSAGRPSAGNVAAEKHFLEEVQQTAGTNFTMCKQGMGLTAAQFDNSTLTPCADQSANACEMVIRARGSARRGVRTLFYGRCTYEKACINNVRQNFVGLNKRFHQCKPHNRLSYRYPHSECTMCTKISDGTHNIVLPDATTLISTNGTTLDLVTAVNNPETYFAWTSLTPMGATFETPYSLY